MINANWKHGLAAAMLGVCALGSGCKSNEAKAIGKAKAALSTMPVRGFFQLASHSAGQSFDIDAMVVPGTDVVDAKLVGIAGANGTFDLAIDEASGVRVPLTTTAAHHVRAMSGETQQLRITCATHVTGIYRGPGARGDVYEYDKTQGSVIECWTSLPGTTTWTPLAIAPADSTTPMPAFWVFAMVEGDTPDTLDISYLKDSQWEPQNLVSFGRPSTDRMFLRTIVMQGSVATLGGLVDDDYPNMLAASENLTHESCMPGQCGYVWLGTSWQFCGGCDTGTCNRGTCSTGTCVPKAMSDLCKDAEEGEKACGQRYDGCSSLVNCDPCAAGTQCGAEGDLLHCGSWPQPRTPASLRAAYQDKLSQLCGVFNDSVTGTTVDLGTTCPKPTQSCVSNLCVPTDYPPPDDEVVDDNTYVTDAGPGCMGCDDAGQYTPAPDASWSAPPASGGSGGGAGSGYGTGGGSGGMTGAAGSGGAAGHP
jgi:hypothetical protein